MSDDSPPSDDRLEERLAASTKLVELTGALAAEQDLDRILTVVTDYVCDALQSERGSLYLHDDRTDELFTRNVTELEIEEIRVPAGKGVVGWVGEHRKTVNIPDAYQDDRWSSETDKRTGFRTRSILAAPVVASHGDRFLGVLQVLNRRGRPFDAFDERLLESFAAHAAAALERAELLTHARRSHQLKVLLEVGHQIQSGFQPTNVPEFPGYEIASYWQPAESLGGDYYDLVELPDGRLGMIIADVSGHGFGPSLIMATARAMVQVLTRTFSEPEAVLSLVSETMTKDLQDGHFITMAALALDARDHSLTYANAGHGPILLFRADGRAEELDSTAMPMGFVEDHIVPTGRLLRMEPGDVLVLPTDGVIELRSDDDELFTRERLEEVVRAHQSAPAAELLQHVRDAMDAFQPNGNADDDVTLVIVSRRE